MMIVFQNKIIYMPSVPPFSRREKVADYERLCRPVVWRQEKIRSLDGTSLGLCIGKTSGPALSKSMDIVMLYFQGYGWIVRMSLRSPRLMFF